MTIVATDDSGPRRVSDDPVRQPAQQEELPPVAASCQDHVDLF